jgi:hypothetical protein
MSCTRARRHRTQERSRARTARKTLLQCRRDVEHPQTRVRADTQGPHRPEETGPVPEGRVYEDASSRGASRPSRQARFHRNRSATARQGELRQRPRSGSEDLLVPQGLSSRVAFLSFWSTQFPPTKTVGTGRALDMLARHFDVQTTVVSTGFVVSVFCSRPSSHYACLGAKQLVRKSS